jgi:hypothetical protein
MPFRSEITPSKDQTGMTVYTVIVTIDGVQTSRTFSSKGEAERFDMQERLRFLRGTTDA